MSKTLEEMAEEFCSGPHEKDAFFAGYQAAKDEYQAKIKELETELENWKHTAIHGDEGL